MRQQLRLGKQRAHGGAELRLAVVGQDHVLHQHGLVIGNAQLLCRVVKELQQIGKGLHTVNPRLPNSNHIDIRSVQNQNLHCTVLPSESLWQISSAVFSGESVFSTEKSLNAAYNGARF